MAGALRALWSGSLWTKAKLHEAGKVEHDLCRGCGEVPEYIGHVCFKCPATNQLLCENEEEHPMPEEL
eukprot:4766994-Pyramimonas_sp.AAC.1